MLKYLISSSFEIISEKFFLNDPIINSEHLTSKTIFPKHEITLGDFSVSFSE